MADHIGAQIKYWRRRHGGMSQATLAGLTGLSQSYISQIEAGRKGVERRSTLIKFARALQVSVADLLQEPSDPADPLRTEAAAAVSRIRVALIEIEEGETRRPELRGDNLTAAVARLGVLRLASDYVAIARQLPGLLRDAAAVGGLVLAQTAYEAQVALNCLGYRDHALSAARLAVRAAEDAEHPAWIGAARFAHTLAMPVETAATTRRIADRALSDLQAVAADPYARQMLGQLHLSAALWAAVDGRTDDSADHLAAAQEEAATLGDPDDGAGFNLLAFGPTNVNLWRMNIALESAQYARVTELAGQFRPSTLRAVDRHQAYWLAYGRALAHTGRTDPQAVAAFTRAEQIAPVAFSVNTMARDSVQAMLHRARRHSVPSELRTLARRVDIRAN